VCQTSCQIVRIYQNLLFGLGFFSFSAFSKVFSEFQRQISIFRSKWGTVWTSYPIPRSIIILSMDDCRDLCGFVFRLYISVICFLNSPHSRHLGRPKDSINKRKTKRLRSRELSEFNRLISALEKETLSLL